MALKNDESDLFLASRAQKIGMRAIVAAIGLIWLFPVISLVRNSLKVGGLDNYAFVLGHPVNDVPFYVYFVNSFIIALGSSSSVVAVSALAGFAFSKIRFVGRRLVFSLVIMTLAVSIPVIYVPLFHILKSLRLYNTYFAVIIPELVLTLPFAVLMMRNFFSSFPPELQESAHLDGANTVQVFARIFLPLAKPAIVNLGVLQIMWSFQDFFSPMLFLTRKSLFTATVAVNVFRGVYGITGADLGHYNAALVLIGVPAIAIFAVFQRYVVNGITSGSLKE